MTDRNAALVDIGGADSRVGVGFAVGPRTVVTCHHVLRALPGVVAEGSEIAVTFHADRRIRVARVVVDDADADVAVLRVLRTARMPANLTVLRLVDPVVRTEVDVYGYPESRDDGAWNQSVVAGRIGRDRLQLNSSKGVPLQPGFSGGPVIVPETPNVMGMLVETTVAGAHSDALAVPSDVIRGLLPRATVLERVGHRLRRLGAGLARRLRRVWKPALVVVGVGVGVALVWWGPGWPWPPGDCVVLNTTVSTEKDELVAELAQDFEDSLGVTQGCVDVRVTGLTSGVAAAAIADDWQSADAAVTAGNRPDVWLPTSSMSVDQVAAGTKDTIAGGDQLGSVTSSVLAIAVPEADRDELFPEGEEDWARLSELSQDTAFVLGRDNPHNSSSGLAATVATYYAGMSAAGHAEVLTSEPNWAEVAGLVDDTEVGSFVHGVEQSVQRYGLEATGFMREIYDEGQANGVDGERPLNAVVVQEQLIHLYNCNVPEGGQIEELRCDDRPELPLTAVYPTEGSLALDHPFVLLEQGDPDVRAAAKDFYAYLTEEAAQAKFVELGFRDAEEPASPTALLEDTLGVRPGQEQTLLPAPPAAVLDTMLDTWVGIQRRANVTLVVDVSGSMGDSAGVGGPSKLELAQDAANLGIGMLTPEDRLGITVFSDEVRSALPATDQKAAGALPPCAADQAGGCVDADCAQAPAPELRACVVEALRADGNTALYGSVTTAFDQAHELHEADRINAVVVLSDGEETKDPDGLGGLLAHLKDPGLNNDDHRVQVYTVAYGADAASATDALQEIATASGGAFYDATSAEDIGEVMTDVFANFGGDPTRQE